MTRNKIKIPKINNIKHINSIDSCYPEDMKQIIKYCIIVRYTTATENFEEISTVILTWGKKSLQAIGNSPSSSSDNDRNPNV